MRWTRNSSLVEPLVMDSYLEFLFCHFNFVRLHPILCDAAAAVRAQSSERPDHCYKIGRGPKSCLLGHLTGLPFCLKVKLFLSSIFKSVDFRSRMSCIVLDIELADLNVIKELGVFIDGKIQGCPPKNYKLSKLAFWWTNNLHGIVWNSECLNYSDIPQNPLEM